MNIPDIVDYADTNTDDDADIELDQTWIDNYKKEEELYTDFYKEAVTNIKLFLIYINSNNEVEKVANENVILPEKNTLKKDHLISLIKQNQTPNNCNDSNDSNSSNINNNNKYKLLSLLRFNIDIEPEEINNFIEANEQDNALNRFLTQEKYINDIKYKDTINIFQDLNSLYIFFYKQPHQNQNKNIVPNKETKKIIKYNIKSKTRRYRITS
jgi:hypothetical protein